LKLRKAASHPRAIETLNPLAEAAFLTFKVKLSVAVLLNIMYNNSM
jgi:hypothetical protein